MAALSNIIADSRSGDWQSLVEDLRMLVDRFEQGAPAALAPASAPLASAAAQLDLGPPPAFDFSSASQVIQFRKRRNRMFGGDLFGEPTWDMLLDLYAARIEDRRVCVTSLALASGVPVTTALRYIENMTRSGLIVRVDDPADGRRKMVALAPATYRRMAELFGYHA